MSVFEVALFLSCIASLSIRTVSTRATAGLVWAAAVSMGCMAGHMYADGAQVVLAPVYLIVGGLSAEVTTLYLLRRSPTSSPAVLVPAAIVTILTAAFAFLVSPEGFSPPSGDYPVGTAVVRVSQQPDVRARVYYPADLPGAYTDAPSRARLIQSPVESERLADALGVPRLLLSRLSRFQLPSYVGVPLSKRGDSYGLLLLSPPAPWCEESVFAIAHLIAAAGFIVVVDGCGLELSPEETVELTTADAGFSGRVSTGAVGMIEIGGTRSNAAPTGGASLDAREGETQTRTDASSIARGVAAVVIPGADSDRDAAVYAEQDLSPGRGSRDAGPESLDASSLLDVDLLFRTPGILGVPRNAIREPLARELIRFFRRYLPEAAGERSRMQ